MARVLLKLLGGFEAHRDMGQPVEVPGRKAQALLAFLALPPGVAHPRDKLAALLWPEIGAAQARANLRLNLFTLRRALAFADPLRLDGDTVALVPEAVDVDAVTLERAAVAENPDAIAAALAGYRGELLAGLRRKRPRSRSGSWPSASGCASSRWTGGRASSRTSRRPAIRALPRRRRSGCSRWIRCRSRCIAPSCACTPGSAGAAMRCASTTSA